MINKKILIFAPEIGSGGVEKNLFIISNYLRKNFLNVAIISASKKNSKINRSIEFITTKKKYFGLIKNRNFKIFISLALLLKYYLKNKDFITLSFQGNLYCCLLCRLLNIKVVLRSNASISGWSMGKIEKIIFKKISNIADAVIVNSLEFQKEYKRLLNIKTKLIYNPLNKKEIKKLSNQKINFSFFKKKTLNLINIGRLVDQKDQLTTLKAVKILNEKNKIKFKLLIIGNGINKSSLIKFIIKNKIKKYVRILNFRKNPYPYIKKADVLILSSVYEGLPNVLLEALTLKKLVISSQCPTGPKEILDNGKGGLLFEAKNENQLYNKIIFFLKNPEFCNRKINHGNSRLNRFDYNLNLEKYKKLLKKLA
jgi:glycosyltransferase involved in cell wall biosynthesis